MMLKLETPTAVAFDVLMMAQADTSKHTCEIAAALRPAFVPSRSPMTIRTTTGLRITVRRFGAE
jgi:hypothetical protein